MTLNSTKRMYIVNHMLRSVFGNNKGTNLLIFPYVGSIHQHFRAEASR